MASEVKAFGHGGLSPLDRLDPRLERNQPRPRLAEAALQQLAPAPLVRQRRHPDVQTCPTDVPLL